MRKHLHLAGVAAIALSTVLASTSASAANRSSASTTPPKLNKNVTLTVWDYFGAEKNNAERETLQKVVAAFTKKYGIKVNLAGNTNANNTKMCVAGPAGQGPDLVGVPHDQVSAMFACKTVASVPAWAWTPAQKKLYIKAAIQATTLAGKTYAMPWAIETSGIFYNKALIPASFFKPGGTKYLQWSKVINKAKSLNDASAGKFGLGWDIANLYFDYFMISNSGGYVFKYKKGYDWKTIGLSTPGALTGLNLLRDLTVGKYKIIPSTMNGSTAKGLFTQGKLAMYITGPWDEASFNDANIDYGFAPDPSIDGKHASHPFSGLQVYAVNKYSKHANEAFALLSYMTQNMQLPEFKTSGRIPVIKSLLASKTVNANAVAKGIAAAAQSASPMPNIPEMGQVWTPMGDALTAIVKGTDSPKDAATKAVAKIKSDIAKAHGG